MKEAAERLATLKPNGTVTKIGTEPAVPIDITPEHVETTQQAGVAQSAEQRFCKPPVGGSIPLASSINSADDSTGSG